MVRVSTRGSVTIPVHIRRQLNIQPGDEVQFEVKLGQVILRVLPREETDQSVVGSESIATEEETSIGAALSDTIDYLVTQQFFEYPDIIVDRTNTLQSTVPGAGEVIKRMEEMITQHLPLWEKQSFDTFLVALCNGFGYDEEKARLKVHSDTSIILGEDANPDDDEQRQFFLTTLLKIFLTNERQAVNTTITEELEKELETMNADVDKAFEIASNIGLPHFTLYENFRYLLQLASRFDIHIEIPAIVEQKKRVLGILSGEEAIVQEETGKRRSSARKQTARRVV